MLSMLCLDKMLILLILSYRRLILRFKSPLLQMTVLQALEIVIQVGHIAQYIHDTLVYFTCFEFGRKLFQMPKLFGLLLLTSLPGPY
ncbi:hypothetical protein KC19_4G214500 [Ceratodon purpureus]|uniref:Uncharacterized protein n=1 Tax=Ceratodon purpureus TaxID=3225 RepID=A0A8T0IEP7_CERPU|nr:hypothetical protein KC19_4G214500 [Ceratodon purpureus]